MNGAILFSAKTDKYGRELWRLTTPDFDTRSSQIRPEQAAKLTRLIASRKGQANLKGRRQQADTFMFSVNNQFGSNKADDIIGFSADEGDALSLNSQTFSGLKNVRFASTTTLQEFNRQLERPSSIIYFEPFGELYFDQNGRQPGFGDPENSGLFAILKNAPSLSANNINVF